MYTTGYKTHVINNGGAAAPPVKFKHLQIKQHFKEQRALRPETTIGDPLDFQRPTGARRCRVTVRTARIGAALPTLVDLRPRAASGTPSRPDRHQPV